MFSIRSKLLQETGTIVNQVSVALIVSTGAGMLGVQGSNPAVDWKVERRSTAFFAVKFNQTVHFLQSFYYK